MPRSTDTADRAAQEALRLIGPDPDDWAPVRAGVDHNVVVVGAGQSGLTFAFALRRAGIGGVSVIDAAPAPEQAGIWRTVARMRRLRTPKTLPGPELGLPALGFQAWYEAQHGAAAYEALATIPRTDWADYLDWYRRTLAIEPRFGVRLVRIEPAEDRLRLHLEAEGRGFVETTRKIILGTGFAGSGAPYLPEALARLPAGHVAHTSSDIDFEALRGKDVAVVGGAASAFDAAATALEAGAASVHLYARREKIASLPVTRTRAYPGAYDNYPFLPDGWRWKQARRFFEAGSTPPPDAIARVVEDARFHLRLGAPWTEAELRDGRIVTSAGGERRAFDFVIAGTGYVSDPSLRPELAEVAGEVLRWRDRYQPPAGEEDERLGAYPYLGVAHELQERAPDAAPRLRDIHLFNPSGLVSFGLPIGDVPSLRRDVPAVVRRISRDLFFADLEHHEARLFASVEPDFDETAYAPALDRGRDAVAAE